MLVTKQRRGVTVVELSFVIAIMAIIALPFTEFLSQNIKNTLFSSKQLKEQMILEQVMQDMEKHLRSAVSAPLAIDISTPNKITFYSQDPTSNTNSQPTVTQYTYQLKSDDHLFYKNGAVFPDGQEAGTITDLACSLASGSITIDLNPPQNAALSTNTELKKTVHLLNTYINTYINTYTITASAGPNGSITPAGTTTVNYGSNQIYTITPSTGYHLASLSVDGSSVSIASSSIFLDVTTKVSSKVSGGTLSVAATNTNFTDPDVGVYKRLSVMYSYNGVLGRKTVDENDTLNLPNVSQSPYDLKILSAFYGTFATPSDLGYYIAPSYTFTGVTANHTIVATFAHN